MTRFVTLAFMPLLVLPALARQSPKATSDPPPSRIFNRARPAVVVIVAGDANSAALGSGFVVSRDRIATNHHVLEGMNQAYVVFSDGAVKQVSGVVADSIEQDLIILRAETGNRPSLPFGDELSLQQGDPVYALGAPKGLELTFTNGIVSSFRKSEAQFLIQTTAPIAPGSSGGPLFDRAGRVVGVTTSMLSDAPGIYFSVGIGDVKRLLRAPLGVALPLEEWAKRQANPNASVATKVGQGAEGPSLEETVSWMRSFLEAHGNEWGQPLGRSYEELQSNRLIMEDQIKDPCFLVLQHYSSEPVQLHKDLVTPSEKWADLFNLADIDPNAIRVVASHHVHFETHNNQEKIVEMVMGTPGEYDLNFDNFIIDLPENAERFANALKHAVLLCGGKKSPF